MIKVIDILKFVTKTLVTFEIKDTEHTMKYNVKNTKKIIGV